MADTSIQVSASTVTDAVAQGLARLGLSKDEVKVEVIDQGSRGLLGLGARDAVVRLTPIPRPPVTPPAEPRSEVETPRTREPIDLSMENNWLKQRLGPTEEPLLADTDTDEEGEEETFTAPDAGELAWTDAQVAETARQTLTELLGEMGIAGQVTVRPPETSSDGEPAPLTLDVEGEELSVLIGRQGEVLDALQYITRLIVSREVEHWVNLVVDVQHYKQRRAKSLRELAGRIAERVATTNQPVALEPMPPNERRAIHIALRDHPSVTTQSVGKGDKRKVTIIPRR
ncbi:MAG: Jag N-terminal domain-containing protein [Anaerolineae bacterium]|nr:Jag N-terminal domain-containing protein [Anaerolineae bacterium]